DSFIIRNATSGIERGAMGIRATGPKSSFKRLRSNLVVLARLCLTHCRSFGPLPLLLTAAVFGHLLSSQLLPAAIRFPRALARLVDVVRKAYCGLAHFVDGIHRLKCVVFNATLQPRQTRSEGRVKAFDNADHISDKDRARILCPSLSGLFSNVHRAE